MRDFGSVQDLVQSFNSPGLHIHHREAWIAPCPFCDCGEDNPQRKAKSMRGLAVNLDHGGFNCLSCGRHGHVVELAEHFGIKLRHERPSTSTAMPEQQQLERVERPEPIQTAQQRFAELPAVGEYLKRRGFSKESVVAWGIGAAMRFVGGVSLPAVALPMRSEAGEVMGWKYRILEPPDDHSRFQKTTGTPQTLFGLHLLPVQPPYPPIVIAEGELDAVALWQYGIRPVMSIPSGAATMKPEWTKLLDRFGQIFLCYDNDEKGEEGARKAAEAFGIARCKRVRLPVKDAAECLEKGFDGAVIRAAINNAEPIRPAGIPTVAEWYDRAVEWLEAEEKLKKVGTGIYDLDECIGGGLAPGDLTLIYGRTAHGKSTLALSILMNALRNGTWCMSASAEYVDAYHARILVGQMVNKHGFKVSAAEMKLMRPTMVRLPLVPVPDSWDYQSGNLTELLKWANAQGIQLAVFDPLDHIMPEKANTKDYYGDVAAFVRQLIGMLRGLRLHLLVVAPVTKAGDLAGRNTLKHDAWNLIEVLRDEGSKPNEPTSKVSLIIHKARRTGVMGRKLELVYLRDGARIADPSDREATGVPF